MIKLVRNTLGDMGCLFNQEGKKISWDHIKMLYFKEKNEGLKAATKLTNKHIYYYNEKMNVKLATQVLSNSVGNGLKFCKSLGCDEFKDIDATAEFCLIMNDAFDILNCRSKYSKNPYCQALDEKKFEKYEHFSMKFYNYVSGLSLPNGKKVIESGRKTGFVGLIKALDNILKLYTCLEKKYSLAYLLSF